MILFKTAPDYKFRQQTLKKSILTGPIKCYGQFNVPHEPATLDKFSKQCSKVIDKEILYYKANTAAIGKSDAFVGSVVNKIKRVIYIR